MKKYKIYCLKHPVTLEIRYIGVTTNSLLMRLSQHKYDALKKNSNKYLSKWIRKVYRETTLVPIIELVEIATQNNWEEREKYWISFYSNLTNIREGGRGVFVSRDKSGLERSADAHKKAVCLLTKNFELIKKFESIPECALFIKASRDAVGKVLNGNNTNVKGYVVLSEMDYESNNFSKIFKGKSKDVYQYDMDGNLVRKYNTLSEVYHFDNNFKTNHVHTACKNLWVHKGFIWSYTELENILQIVQKKKKHKNNIKI